MNLWQGQCDCRTVSLSSRSATSEITSRFPRRTPSSNSGELPAVIPIPAPTKIVNDPFAVSRDLSYLGVTCLLDPVQTTQDMGGENFTGLDLFCERCVW